MTQQLLIDLIYFVSNGWCQNAHAIDNDSKEVHIDNPDAVAFDLITAIYKVVPEDSLDDIYAAIGMTPIELYAWNNHPDRTQMDAVALLKKALTNV